MLSCGPKVTVVPKQERGGEEQGRSMKSYQSIQHIWHVRDHVRNKVGIYSSQHTTQIAEQYCPWAGPFSLLPSNPGMPHFSSEKSCYLMFYCLERMGSRLGHSCFSLFCCPSAFTFKLICASFYCYTGSSTIPIFPFLQHSYVSLSTASLLLKVESPLTAGCSQLCPVRFCIPPKMEIPQLFSATAKRLTILTVKKRKKKKKVEFLVLKFVPIVSSFTGKH